jgi:uncharacterized protein (DUF2225 family)
MAHWTLECPVCKTVFNHCEVPARSFQDHFMGLIAKPKFPDGGLGIACPNCGQNSMYQSYALIYRDF